MDVFSYDLPDEKIAQRPVHPYDSAKLLVLSKNVTRIQESEFSNFHDFVTPLDLIVFNNTKVIPARFRGSFEAGGGAAEVLILQEMNPHEWWALGKPLKKFKVGATLNFDDHLQARVLEREGTEKVLLKFTASSPIQEDVKARMGECGMMPIPPYIRKGAGDAADRIDYQTFFAEKEGSIAAPTASLHFTKNLVSKIQKKGTAISHLTLHVGAASFLPLWHEHESEIRKPGVEFFQFDPGILKLCEEAKARGGRVIAVGTTVVRALESHALVGQSVAVGSWLPTELFITPGFKFQLVDGIVTNFHQPRTTHLLLVESFLGRDPLEAAYQYALENDFRFLSYGDGMFIS